MNSRLNVIGSALKAVGFIAIGLLMAEMVRAQSSLKAVGEIASASGTTINGSSVISGMTVFSNNRIRTDKQGAAIINLGRLGRIEFGAETDVTLRFSSGSIGGELHSGRLVVSVRAGVAVAINSAKGIITTDGAQPAVLAIDVNRKRALVTAHRGEAGVISGSKVERVEEGEEVAMLPGVEGWRRTRLAAAGASGAAGIASAAQAATQIANPITASAQSLTGLFNTGINYSIKQISGADRGAAQSFETTITCRDNENNRCGKRSKTKP